MTEAVPVVLVRGDDPALVLERIATVVDELAGADSFATEDVSDAEDPAAAAADACRTPPFLGDRRVVVLRDAGRLTAEAATPLVDYLGDPAPTATLVLGAGGGTLPAKLATAARAAGRVDDTGVPFGRARAGWLTDRLKAAAVSFEPAAVEVLGAALEGEEGRLASVLDLLVAAYGEGARLGPDDVAPFVGAGGDVAPWDLTDAIDRGETARALEHLGRMLGAGERHPLVVLATLQRHYTAMLRLDGSGVTDENAAAALLGVKPYPAKKALQQARRLGSRGLARAVTLLADADLDVRGASAWPDHLVLEVLVARLSRLGPAAATAARGRGSRRR